MTTSLHSAFASDNCSPVCPQVWDLLAQANLENCPAYGNDPWTHQALDKIKEFFECDCDIYFTFNGTAANSLALASMCQSYHSIIAHESAHIETDECGAPEFYSNGTKLLLVPGQNGKVDLEKVEQVIHKRTDIHFPKPRVLSLTQSTELGTVYSVDELKKVGELTRRLGIGFHMDGARFANALASLGVSPKEITWQIGVDVLCLGATKNGSIVGDCVVFFNSDLAKEFGYRCKQAGQLASKMRYLSAPWLALLEGNTWLHNAKNANEMASLLAQRLSQLPEVELLYPVESNSVFVRMPELVKEKLRSDGWLFYDFIGSGGSRLMGSWNTTAEQVEIFCENVESAMETVAI